jgi:ribA/ribD-fused uncharacterized protein
MAIKGFFNSFRFLSNFWPAKIRMRDGAVDLVFVSSEHAYQYYKTLDPIWRNQILNARTAGQAKKLSQKCPMRSDWDTIKLEVMKTVVWEKFNQNSHLKQQLLLTGDEYLEETNNWGDTFWGVCNGVGENWLGRILMDTRERLK